MSTPTLTMLPGSVDLAYDPRNPLRFRIIGWAHGALDGRTFAAKIGTVTLDTSVVADTIEVAATSVNLTDAGSGAGAIPWILLDADTDTIILTGYARPTTAGGPSTTSIYVTQGSQGELVVQTIDLAGEASAVAAQLQVHIDDAVGAHAATAISFAPTDDLAPTNVQDALAAAGELSAGLTTGLAAEIGRATTAESTLGTNLGTEVTNRTSADTAEAAARTSADALLIPLSQKGANSGVATLDSGGKVPAGQIPQVAISNTFVVASQAAMLALSAAEQGDVAVRTDLSKSFILLASPPATLGNWQELLTPASPVQSVNGRVGSVTGLAEASDLTAETSARTAADTTNATAITNEISARTTAVAGEATARAAADALKIDKTTVDANSLLGGITDDTPVAIPVGASQFVGRKASGNVTALTPAEAITILAVYTAAQTDSAISAQINALVGGAPGLLDTLKEIADALGDDPNFAATMTTALANKQPLNAALTAIAALTTQTYGRSLLTVASQGALATALAGDNAFTTTFASLSGVNHFTGASSTFDHRPITAEQCFFNGIPTDGTTDATTALTALAGALNDVGTLTIANGEIVYVGVGGGATYALSTLHLDIKPGGKIRVDPTVTFTAPIVQPGLRTIIHSRTQNIAVTATGGTFLFHGGSSSTGTGSSTTAINVSGLTNATLQTAIRTLTGFSGVTVAGSGATYTITFANDLTNLTVDATAATGGGTVTIQRGTFAPTNQGTWDPIWWNQVGTYDDTATWLSVVAAAAAVSYTDPLTFIVAGQRIRAPFGKNQFFGVTLTGCLLDADPAFNFFYPPSWNPGSGAQLSLKYFSTVRGGTWRTNGSGQAVTLIQTVDTRVVVEDAYLAHQAYGSIGIAAGVFGAPGSTSPEVRRIRGVGNSTQRLITVTATGGTFVIRGGSSTSTPSTTAPVSVSGLTAIILRDAIRTLPGFGAASVAGSAGVFTATITPLAFFDIDATNTTTPANGVTVESYGTGIQVNTPDFKGEDIWLGAFKKGIESNNGAGRLHKFHPFSCDYGITGNLSFWTITEPYWDTNNIWAMDAPNANSLTVSDSQSEGNGFALGGGCLRIQQTGGHACSHNRIEGGTLDDDYGTMILIDGASGTYINIRLRSRSVEQSAGSPVATYGIHITAASSLTTVRVQASTADFITKAVLDEASDSDIELGRFRQVLGADVLLPTSSTAYGNVNGSGPPISAGEIWDVRLKIFADTASNTPDMKTRVNTPTGCVGYLMMVCGMATGNTSGTNGGIAAANAVATTPTNNGVPCGLLSTSLTGILFEGVIDNSAGTTGRIPWQAAQNTSDVGQVTIRKNSIYEGVRRA